MHKIKSRTAPSSFIKKFEQLLILIQHTFQVRIRGNHKLFYADVDFEFPLEVQQYGTT